MSLNFVNSISVQKIKREQRQRQEQGCQAIRTVRFLIQPTKIKKWLPSFIGTKGRKTNNDNLMEFNFFFSFYDDELESITGFFCSITEKRKMCGAGGRYFISSKREAFEAIKFLLCFF